MPNYSSLSGVPRTTSTEIRRVSHLRWDECMKNLQCTWQRGLVVRSPIRFDGRAMKNKSSFNDNLFEQLEAAGTWGLPRVPEILWQKWTSLPRSWRTRRGYRWQRRAGCCHVQFAHPAYNTSTHVPHLQLDYGVYITLAMLQMEQGLLYITASLHAGWCAYLRVYRLEICSDGKTNHAAICTVISVNWSEIDQWLTVSLYTDKQHLEFMLQTNCPIGLQQTTTVAKPWQNIAIAITIDTKINHYTILPAMDMYTHKWLNTENKHRCYT